MKTSLLRLMRETEGHQLPSHTFFGGVIVLVLVVLNARLVAGGLDRCADLMRVVAERLDLLW